MSFVEHVYGWAKPYRPSSFFDRIRRWREGAGSWPARSKPTVEDALIRAIDKGKIQHARQLLKRGAAGDAQDFKALRILTTRQKYAHLAATFDEIGFTRNDVTKFAYAGLRQAAIEKSEKTDVTFLWKLTRIVGNDIPAQREEHLRDIQLQAMRSAKPEVIALLLDGRPEGFNEMLNEKRDLAAAGLIDPVRQGELNDVFSHWAVGRASVQPVFRIRQPR